MDSFLLVGQSNMAGRGFTNEVPEFENNHLFVLRNGRWQQMFRPVVCDRYFSGVCLAESFADSYSRMKRSGAVPLERPRVLQLFFLLVGKVLANLFSKALDVQIHIRPGAVGLPGL